MRENLALPHWCISWEIPGHLPHRRGNVPAMLHALRIHAPALTGFLRASVAAMVQCSSQDLERFGYTVTLERAA